MHGPPGECQRLTRQAPSPSLPSGVARTEAIDSYQFLLDRYPNTAYFEKALYLMAVALVQDQRHAEVVTHVYAILKSAPASPTPWQAQTYYWVAESYFNIVY